MPDELQGRDCFSMHTGIWCVEPQTANQLKQALQNGDLEALVEKAQQADEPELMDKVVRRGSVAIVPISGSLTKGKSSLGGTSTVEVRKVLGSLSQDNETEEIILHIDSPGGHVAGVADLANDVRRLAEGSDGPGVTAFIEDMGASAAYWIGSQASQVFAANRVTKVGSIGVRTVVHDVSEAYEERGVKVISMATGPRKDDFVRGKEVEDEAIEAYESQIEAIHDVFVETVARGRGMSKEAVAELATGETFLAEEAKENGLVDDIVTLPSLVSSLQQSTNSSPTVPGVSAATDGTMDASSAMGSIGSQRIMEARLFDHAHLQNADADPVEEDSSTSQPLSNDQQGKSKREPAMDDPEDEEADGPDEEPSLTEVLGAIDTVNENVGNLADKVSEVDSRVSALEEDAADPSDDLLDKLEERRQLQSKREDAARILGCDPDELSGAPENVLDKVLENPENAMQTEPLIDIPDAQDAAEDAADIPGLDQSNWYKRSKERQAEAAEKLANHGKGGS